MQVRCASLLSPFPQFHNSFLLAFIEIGESFGKTMATIPLTLTYRCTCPPLQRVDPADDVHNSKSWDKVDPTHLNVEDLDWL